CPEEGGRTSESDEEKWKAEARVARIQQCQEILSNQDQQICTYLEEKLHIYAELGELSGFEDVHLEPHLLKLSLIQESLLRQPLYWQQHRKKEGCFVKICFDK
ncbi:Hypothetical predicted protein, partial [Marmota monax]